MAAQHINVAREQGAIEGFKFWKKNLKRSGIPQVQERYQELLEQGDDTAQFRFYCAEYGDQFGLKKQPKAEPATPAPAATGDLQHLFAEFLAAQGIALPDTDTEPEVEDDEPEIDADSVLAEYETPTAVMQPSTRKPRSSGATKAAKGKITNGQAHAALVKALGTDADKYKPRDPNVAATQGKLWKLNDLGLLTLKA